MNNTRTIALSVAILFSSILTIWAEYYGHLTHLLLFKSLTMLLIIYLTIQVKEYRSSIYKKFIVIGLIFSLGGDVFLIWPDSLFIQGLISFLIAHIFYILAFTSGRKIQVRLLNLIPFAVFGIFALSILYTHLGPMLIPVTIYISVIMIMGWQALDQWRVEKDSFIILALIGAVLFIISDFTLAMNKFVSPFATARLITLGTYFPAQWFISMSIRNK